MIWKILQPQRKALRPRIEKIFFSGDIVMVKHDIPNRPSMIVQSIDKLASGDRVAYLV
jgi:hypothetical protein